MCIDVDVAQSVNGDPCSMLSVDIGVFVTIVCHLFHGEQMSIFGNLFLLYVHNSWVFVDTPFCILQFLNLFKMCFSWDMIPCHLHCW